MPRHIDNIILPQLRDRRERTKEFSSLETRYRSTLAAIASLSPGAIDPYEVALLYDDSFGINGKREQVVLFQKYIPNTGNPRLDRERRSLWGIVAEGLLNRPTGLTTYGVHAQTYLAELSEKRRSTSNFRALLVGALTPYTVREFAQTVRHVFPDATLAVMDIEGIETRKEAENLGIQFIQESVLALGESPAYDCVHTSVLLGDLQGSGTFGDLRTAISKMYAALLPEGKLVMVEQERMKETIARALIAEGIQATLTIKILRISRRRTVDDYYAGNRTVGSNLLHRDTTICSFVASKA